MRDWEQRRKIHEEREEGHIWRVITQTLRKSTPPDSESNAQDGLLDGDLAKALRQIFGNKIYGKKEGLMPEWSSKFPYTPDVVYHDPEINLWIDIEVDDPCARKNGEYIPRHYLGADDKRNQFFLDRNWIIIRFTEEQVFDYLQSCCKTVVEVISTITRDPRIRTEFSETPSLKPVKHWTQRESWEMIQQRTRKRIFDAKGVKHY